MAKAGVIEIDMQANTARFQSDIKKATAALNSNVAQMRRSTSALESSFKQLNSGISFLTKGIVAFAAVQAAGQILKTADAFNQLNARVKNSLDSATQFDSVFKQLVASSNRSGVSIDAVAQAFTRLRPAANELGMTNDQLIRFNETFSKMGALAGATGEEMKYTMIQLSQGLASGTLRGDELRSVMEQMPQVARTIADSMGIPFKDFKKAAEDGKISAEAVFNAILGKADEVDQQFQKLPGSVERSFSKLSNEASILTGSLDNTFQITKSLSQGIDALAGALGGLSGFVNTNRDILAFSVGVAGATTATVALSRALVLLPPALLAARNGFMALIAVAGFGSGGLGAALLAVAGLAGGAFVLSMQRTAETTALVKRNVDSLKTSIEQEARAVFDNAQTSKALVQEYDNLSKKTSLAIGEKKRMSEITETLNKKFPTLHGNIDALAHKLGSMSAAYRQATIEAMAFAQVEKIAEERKRLKSAINQRQVDFSVNNAWQFAGSGLGPGVMGDFTKTKRFAVLQNETKALQTQVSALDKAEKEALQNARKLYDSQFAGVKGGSRGGAGGGGGGRASSGGGSRKPPVSEAQKEMDRLKQLAQQWIDATRTGQEELNQLLATGAKLRQKDLIDLETLNAKIQEEAQRLFGKESVLFAGGKAFSENIAKHSEEAISKLSEPFKEFTSSFNTNLGDALNDPAFQAVQQVIQDTLTPLERYNQEVERLNWLHENAGLSTETWTIALQQAKENLSETKNKAQEFAQAIGNVTAEFGDRFFNTVVEGMKTGKMAFKEFVASALEDLAKLIFKLTVAIPLANALSNALGGKNKTASGAAQGAASSIGSSLVGGLLKGAGKLLGFADGGRPPVGVPSMVGERGPELFVPDRAGTIIPNHALGGGGQVIQVTNVFNISTGVQQTVRSELNAMMPSIEKRTTAAVQTAIGRGGKMAAAVGVK